jgi:hypothetical protein
MLLCSMRAPGWAQQTSNRYLTSCHTLQGSGDQFLLRPLWSMSWARAVPSAGGVGDWHRLSENSTTGQIRRSRMPFHKASTPDPTIRKMLIQVNTSLHHSSAMGHRLVDKSWLECRPAAATLTGHIAWSGRWFSHCGGHTEQWATQFFSWPPQRH